MSGRAGQEVRPRSVPLDGSSFGRLARASAGARFPRASRWNCANSGRIIETNLPALDRSSLERIISKESCTIEIRVVKQWRKLRNCRYPEARVDHASGHDTHAERAGSMNNSQRFAEAPAFRELQIHSVHRAGKTRNICRNET